ncbi:capping protein inhibiting regulator of actin dynamics isoform X1 [Amia ocellicauda]
MGTRAFSHDSIFIPDGSEEGGSSETTMSQESVSDKVRSLQRQIAHSIKFGQKPASFRKSTEAEGSSDEEELPRSPLKVIAQVEAKPAEGETKGTDLPRTSPSSEAGNGTSEEKQDTPVKSPRTKRAFYGTIESINLDSVPLSVPRLDNAAAKHKLAVKPKNQRVSKKHRRLTQDLQDLSLPGTLQEETDVQKHADSLPKPVEHQLSRSKEQSTHDEEQGMDFCMTENESLEESKKIQEESGLLEDLQRHEEQRIQEAEAQIQREMEEKRQTEMEEQRRCEIEEQQKLEAEKQRQKKEEEHRLREAEERRKEEERRLREIESEKQNELEKERLRKAEEERLWKEEQQRQREMEEKKQRELEEEQNRLAEEQKEEERKKRDAENRLREIEEQRQHEERLRKEAEEKRLQEEKEEKLRQAEEERLRLMEEEMQREAAKRKQRELEEQKFRELEELRLQKKKKLGEQTAENQERMEEERKQSGEKNKHLEEPEKATALQEESPDPQEQKRKAEELRWREMEERQTTPRPFTFKVSSGEKQFLFEKVNLTPVTPSTQQSSVPDAKEFKTSPKGAAPHSLPSSLYVPHTAILVTGAQLCGTAVNLNQIKDTACKSLLGLAEDKKAMDIPPISSLKKTSPERKSSKTKSLNESSGDQSSAAMLAEWASIRSKIFKSAENGTFNEKDIKHHSRPTSDNYNQKALSGLHSSLRKTMSANAKFSITPAWQKFTDGNKTNENKSIKAVSPEEKDNSEIESCFPDIDSIHSAPLVSKTQDKPSKSVRIADSTEGCVFAKDLPSFLVPSPPHGSSKVRSISEPQSPPGDSEDAGTNRKGHLGEEKLSPFGIKLRRTNYSLRFHSEQPTEKRKKRYSAGDSFEGIPTPLIATASDRGAPVFSNVSSPTPSSLRERSSNSATEMPQVATEPKLKPSKIVIPVIRSESEKLLSKPPLYQKPLLAPKPVSVTPPSSPLAKMDKYSFGDVVAQRTTTEDLALNQKKEERRGEATAQLQKKQQEEEEPKEKRSFFPSINIPWREKTDRKTELIRREKPALQSRHSLDSSRVSEKGESSQPLWITLALQKQKGFREQQMSREERKQMREAKLVEKQAKENTGLTSPSDNKGSSNNTVEPKPPAQEEEKKPDSLLSRFERREQLKKSNTLPNSVTVEISDPTSPAPAVKDVAKRFPTSDSPQVSTEPAWLALAKRKAKAWSDCPQIIK